jgi:hypothetical protein
MVDRVARSIYAADNLTLIGYGIYLFIQSRKQKEGYRDESFSTS